MKKLFLYALPLLLAACEPSTESAPELSANLTAEQLQAIAKVEQSSAGSNIFKLTTTPTTIVQVSDQDGNLLYAGTSNDKIIGVPPLTKIVVKAINQDGTITSYSKDVQVSTYTDVPEIYSGLFGPNYTSQTWVWDTESPNGVWGNGQYGTHSSPEWWKVSAAEITEQATGKGLPNDGIDGWMKFTLKGRVVEKSSGEKGTLSWDTSAKLKDGYDLGTLTFNGVVPLMGIQPNSNNQKEYVYHILKMDGKHLYLVAPEPGAGDGGNGWFWCFKAK